MPLSWARYCVLSKDEFQAHPDDHDVKRRSLSLYNYSVRRENCWRFWLYHSLHLVTLTVEKVCQKVRTLLILWRFLSSFYFGAWRLPDATIYFGTCGIGEKLDEKGCSRGL